MPTLKQLQHRITDQLNSASNSNKKEFDKKLSGTEEDILKYIWKYGVPHDFKIENGNTNINRKGAKDSEAFRNEGNRLYKCKKFDKALIAYNYALLAAPHPNCENFTATNADVDIAFKSEYECGQFSELFFAFANRSALLLELEQYKYSISDIDNSLVYGYTHSKRYKMFERKVKCLVGLRKFDEARNLSDSILNNLSDFKIDSNELGQLRTSLNRLKTKCESVTVDNTNTISADNNSSSNNNKTKYWQLFYQGGDMPVVSSPHEGAVSKTSTGLVVRQSSSKGRHLVASRDISPGEVLMVEDSLCGFVHHDHRLRLYCSACMRRAPVPLPCDRCSLVVFCSAVCRSVALVPRKGSHALQCQLLPCLVALQPDVDAGIVLDIMTTTSMQDILEHDSLMKQKLAVDKNDTNGYAHALSETNSSNKLLDELLEDTIDRYQFILSLEGNQSIRNADDKRDSVITGIILLKILMELPDFWIGIETHLDQHFEDSKEFLTLGKHIIRLLYNTQCNAHCIKELQIIEDKSAKGNCYNNVGYAVFQKMSLLNHSCVPNTHQSSDGNRKILYVISTIKKGDEVTLSYGERYVSHDKEHRNRNLSNTYLFTCNCLACKLNWPMYEDLPIKFNLRCCKCSNAIDTLTSKCKKCQLVHKGISKKDKKGGKKQQMCFPNLYDAAACQKEISKAWSEYNVAYKNISEINTDMYDLDKIKQVVSLLDKYAHHPNKPYTDAQETFIRWFDLRAAASFNLE